MKQSLRKTPSLLHLAYNTTVQAATSQVAT
jgi:hypothetical protein